MADRGLVIIIIMIRRKILHGTAMVESTGLYTSVDAWHLQCQEYQEY
jgi:hypothetical protein